MYHLNCPISSFYWAVNIEYQKKIFIKTQIKDRYGRTIGVVFLDNQNINNELVKQCMAWVYKKYTDNKIYSKNEPQGGGIVGLTMTRLPSPSPRGSGQGSRRCRPTLPANKSNTASLQGTLPPSAKPFASVLSALLFPSPTTTPSQHNDTLPLHP